MKISTAPSLIFLDSGPQTGSFNMSLDQKNLEAMNVGALREPVLRFFEWSSPTVSYGYLQDPKLVEAWSQDVGNVALIKRPTGGSVVLHLEKDLSFSLLWPRGSHALPDRPKAAYHAIHEALMKELESFEGLSPLFLSNGIFLGGAGHRSRTISLCFQEPVCDDVMIGGKKVVGGALRIARNAILYQGHVSLMEAWDKNRLKSSIRNAVNSLISA